MQAASKSYISFPTSPFVETLGVGVSSVPTVHIDYNQHSPDEHIRLGSFDQGIAMLPAVLGQDVDRRQAEKAAVRSPGLQSVRRDRNHIHASVFDLIVEAGHALVPYELQRFQLRLYRVTQFAFHL